MMGIQFTIFVLLLNPTIACVVLKHLYMNIFIHTYIAILYCTITYGNYEKQLFENFVYINYPNYGKFKFICTLLI